MLGSVRINRCLRGLPPRRRSRRLEDLLPSPARLPHLAYPRVPRRLRELSAIRPPDQRVVQERRLPLPTQEAPEPDLRRRGVDQVAAADDEADVLAQVVDDDAER